MIVELPNGKWLPLPCKTIPRVLFCPKKLLDGLPLDEIKAYVKEREAV